MLAGKGDNSATPAAMVALLAKVARGQLGLSRASARHLDKLLLAVTTGPNRLKAGVPPGTPVAHKTGTSGTTNGVTDATNDAGLLGTGKARIAVAVFVRASPADEATRERVIADLARAAWETFRAPPGQPAGSSKKNVAPRSGLALGPDAAAVALDDAVDGGQTDAGPLELGRLVQALERREEAVGVLHVEAGAVVAHVERGPAPSAARARPRCAPPTRDEYFQALPSRFSIAARKSPGRAKQRRPGCTSTSTSRSGSRAPQVAPPPLRQRRQIDFDPRQRAAGRPGPARADR